MFRRGNLIFYAKARVIGSLVPLLSPLKLEILNIFYDFLSDSILSFAVITPNLIKIIYKFVFHKVKGLYI